MPKGSIVLKVTSVNSGKKVYPRLVIGDKSLSPLQLSVGDEVFVESMADCIIIRPCHPKTKEQDE